MTLARRIPRFSLALFALLALPALAGCASVPVQAPRIALGCEDARDGAAARAVAIYARVLAEPVCLLDARGRCHMRYAPGTVVARPAARAGGPPIPALAAGLTRRGLDIGILTPHRRSREFAALTHPGHASAASDAAVEPELVIHLGAIELADDGRSAAVSMLVLRPSAPGGGADMVDPTAPAGSTVYRLTRLDPTRGMPRRILDRSPATACWRLDAWRGSVVGN
jgi:hypothetical protein